MLYIRRKRESSDEMIFNMKYKWERTDSNFGITENEFEMNSYVELLLQIVFCGLLLILFDHEANNQKYDNTNGTAYSYREKSFRLLSRSTREK